MKKKNTTVPTTSFMFSSFFKSFILIYIQKFIFNLQLYIMLLWKWPCALHSNQYCIKDQLFRCKKRPLPIALAVCLSVYLYICIVYLYVMVWTSEMTIRSLTAARCLWEHLFNSVLFFNLLLYVKESLMILFNWKLLHNYLYFTSLCYNCCF